MKEKKLSDLECYSTCCFSCKRKKKCDVMCDVAIRSKIRRKKLCLDNLSDGHYGHCLAFEKKAKR